MEHEVWRFWITKLDADLITPLPASDSGSAAAWGSKRINPRPQSCLCLTWMDTLQTTTTITRIYRTHKQEVDLMIYINFSKLEIPNNSLIEVEIIQNHLSTLQQLDIANMYILPSYHQRKRTRIFSTLRASNLPKAIITADINGHSPLKYSPI